MVSSYTRLVWVVYSGEVRGRVGTRSRMCCVGRMMWYMGSAIPYNISHFTHDLHDNGNVNTTTKQITLYLPQVNPHYTNTRRITS